MTVTSNTVNITGGYGIVCGREFVINSDSLTVTLAPSGTLQGRLYVRLDLADADAPIQLLTATGNTLPALTQDDDVNYTNGVWEMELATFTVGVSALSDCVETYETIMGGKTDYIVEQGSSGIWTYRKWNSGVAECWGYKLTNGTFSSWGSVYSHDVPPEDFPTGLFTSMPVCVSDSSCTSQNSVCGPNANYTTKDHAPGITLLRGSSAPGTLNFATWYYAKGTWK
ncbi:MAG: hypothetical protein IIZ94_07675 [Prevotella sp.]|nr:hypothetical protein [Prevotella sp.]